MIALSALTSLHLGGQWRERWIGKLPVRIWIDFRYRICSRRLDWGLTKWWRSRRKYHYHRANTFFAGNSPSGGEQTVWTSSWSSAGSGRRIPLSPLMSEIDGSKSQETLLPVADTLTTRPRPPSRPPRLPSHLTPRARAESQASLAPSRGRRPRVTSIRLPCPVLISLCAALHSTRSLLHFR